MGLTINSNSAAMAAHRTLSNTSNALSKSIERLSSGFRISSAGDDPAGLVISEKLRAQVSGIGQAIKNASDATNMVKTAEGALNEVNSLLRSMRDLAVHAANTGATDAASAQADQSQITNAINSLNKIALETQFGSRKLLDGSAGIKTMINGSSVMSGDFSLATGIKDGADIKVQVTTAAEKATLSSAATYADASASFADDTGSLYVNGVKISYASGDSVDTFISNVNAQSNLTGVAATYNTTTNEVDFKTTDYGSAAKVNVTSGAMFLGSGVANSSDAGADAVATVTQTVGSVTTNLSDTSWSVGSGLTIRDSFGNKIVLTEAGGSATSAASSQFTVEKNTLTFQLGAYANQTREINIGSAFAYNLGNGAVANANISTIDVTTSQGAQDAIKVMDQAISDVSSTRAALGATQKNVLDSSSNSLSVAKENISASESSIRDTDMAAEMVQFTKLQMLNQVGVAMLAQANQAPQQLLSLLR